MSPPLSHLKVLDLSRFIAGPHCAMLLGDMGADVVKIERVGKGDDTRGFFPRLKGQSTYYMAFNRNKRSFALDFRNPEAQALLRDLIARADILVENFRPGTMEKMGCGWETLEAINPRLIMARISGFGQTNSKSSEPCFDGIAQAQMGLMSITGPASGQPTMCGTFISDYSTALYATIGIMAALENRHQTGKGQVVDVSLIGSSASLLMTALIDHLALGQTAMRTGNRDRYTAPGNTFRTQDGDWIHIVAGNDAHFPNLARMMGREDLTNDPRFRSVKARMNNVDAIETIVSEWMAGTGTEAAIQALRTAEIPSSKVRTIREVAEDSFLREAGALAEIDHPVCGKFSMQGLAINLSDSPCEIRIPPPALGQHNAEILSEWLGYENHAISELRARAVI